MPALSSRGQVERYGYGARPQPRVHRAAAAARLAQDAGPTLAANAAMVVWPPRVPGRAALSCSSWPPPSAPRCPAWPSRTGSSRGWPGWSRPSPMVAGRPGSGSTGCCPSGSPPAGSASWTHSSATPMKSVLACHRASRSAATANLPSSGTWPRSCSPPPRPTSLARRSP
jgi:hypothetical protein